MLRLMFILPMLVASLATAAEIAEILESPTEIEQFAIGEIKFSVLGEFANPFDPQEIEVWAKIKKPDDSEFILPAFYTRDFDITFEDGGEIFTAKGEPYFCARMTCEVVGTHAVQLCAKDSNGQSCSKEFEVECVPSDNRGFIRVNPKNQRYFADSQGNTFLPIGINQCWGKNGGSFDYEQYFSRLAQVGGNFSRLWQTHFNAGYLLEWGDYHPSGIYCGLGCYSLQAAARLDRIFQLAKKLGIYILWSINQHSQFETSMWSSWGDNPFNSKNGGPCDSSRDFFTSEEANRLYDARLRYLVARYSAFTSLFAWELFNEIELISGVDINLLNSWQRKKSELIKSLDPYEHLVTTSYANPIYVPSWHDWEFDGYDFVQKHIYISNALPIIDIDGKRLFSLTKPYIVGEIGLDFRGELEEQDPLGIAYHNAIWCALATGYAGTPASWWWDSWVEDYNWYRHLLPVSELTKIFDFAQLEARFENASIHSLSAKLEAFGMRGKKSALIWVHDKRSQWHSEQTENFHEVSDAVLIPYDLCGKYFIRVFNTWSGKVIQESIVKGCAPTIKLPTFSRDIAIIFEEKNKLAPDLKYVREEGEEKGSKEGCGCSIF